MIKLRSAQNNYSEQYMVYRGNRYAVMELNEFAKDIKVITVPIESIAMDYSNDMESLIMIAQYIKDVNNAKLKYPILLAPCGRLLDGRHRIVKSILKGNKTIKIKRLESMPGHYGKE